MHGADESLDVDAYYKAVQIIWLMIMHYHI